MISVNTIIRETEEIVGLAKDIQTKLEKHNIEEVKKGIKSLITIGHDELRRIQAQFGDKYTIKECYTILSDAEQILTQIEIFENQFGQDHIFVDKSNQQLLVNLTQMINRIIINENNIIYEVKNDMKKLELIRKAWEKNISFRVVFHGTNSAAVSKIKRYGLVPGMKIWDLRELNILIELMRKAGCNKPIGYWFETQDKVIYYTVRKDGAIDYARRSPEFWSQLINPILKHNVANNLGYDNAFRTICAKLVGDDNSRLENISKNQLIKYVKLYSKLNREEINLGLDIFYRLWEIFGNTRPIVVHISIKAPPLIEKYCTDTLDNFLEAFSSYLHYVEHLPDQNTNYLQIPVDKINEKVNNFYNNWNVSDIDGRVYERIPSQYILKYEAV